MKRILAGLFLLAFMLVMVTNCAHIRSIDRTGEEALRQQVETEWNAKVDKKWGTVYDLTTESYRKEIKRNIFIKRANAVIKSFDIREIRILDSGVNARAKVDCVISPMGHDFNMNVTEKWVMEDGEWRLDMKPLIRGLFSN